MAKFTKLKKGSAQKEIKNKRKKRKKKKKKGEKVKSTCSIEGAETRIPKQRLRTGSMTLEALSHIKISLHDAVYLKVKVNRYLWGN